MPRTTPTKAARKAAFDLTSAQLEVGIAHAEWQRSYADVDVDLSTLDRQEASMRWRLEALRLTHELAVLKLAYVGEEARIAALKRAGATRRREAV